MYDASGWRRLWRPGRRWYRQPALVLVVVPAVLLGALLLVVAVYLFAAVPLPDDVVTGATRVLDRTGKEIGSLSPVAAREDVSLESLPEHVPQAVMAAEDRNFYNHLGLSPKGMLRALFTNVAAGEIEQGGSTITQQYIKNAAVGSERSFARKAKEAMLAIKLERRFSKDEILEFYLNTVYLGRGASGVEAAAKTYFNTSASNLDTNQAATLAGMIQAPERFDPAEDPGAAKIRRDYVLDGMAEQGWLPEADARVLQAQPLPATSNRQSVRFGAGAYYLDAVKQDLAGRLGGENAVYRGLVVTTEMDPAMQRAAERVLVDKLAELRADIPGRRLEKIRQLSGAIVSIDTADGGVRALVGGPDFGRQQFNAAIDGPHQPGSAFKPFGLAAFVDAGNSPRTRFRAPSKIELEFEGHGAYEVENFGGDGYGRQTVHQATLTSTNTVFVQMAREIGPARVMELAARAGVPESRMEALPSLILGSKDVTVLDMAEGFATFAAGGVHTEPRFVREVVDADGDRIIRNRPQRQGRIRANVAYITSDILQDNIKFGTGRRARLDRPAAGKTGTTQDSADAWFVGYVPQLSTAIWFGDLANNPMGTITGGGIPAEAWGEYMADAVADLEVEDFPEPDYTDFETDADEPVVDVVVTPEPAPSPTETLSPSPTACPDGLTVVAPGDACPSPSPTDTSASPEPSPTPTPEPTPTETTAEVSTETTTEPAYATPARPPTQQPSPSESARARDSSS